MLCAGRVSSAGGMRTTHTPAIAQPSAVSILQARPADVATGGIKAQHLQLPPAAALPAQALTTQASAQGGRSGVHVTKAVEAATAALPVLDAMSAAPAQVIDPYQIAPVRRKPGEPVKVYTLPQNPKFSIIPDFVTAEEAEHLLKLGGERWQLSQVTSGRSVADGQTASEQLRTSHSCLIHWAQTAVVRSVEERAAAVAGVSVDCLERLNLVRYRPGEFFKVHHDGSYRPKTLFLYLNDLPEDDEAETHFPKLGLKFKPRCGCAVMWPNVTPSGAEDYQMLHQGLPPKTAVKYGVNLFFQDKPLRMSSALARPPRCDGPHAHINAVDIRQAVARAGGRMEVGALAEHHRVHIACNLATEEEVQQLLQLARVGAWKTEVGQTVLVLDVGQTKAMQCFEAKVARVLGVPVQQVTSLELMKCAAGHGQDLWHGGAARSHLLLLGLQDTAPGSGGDISFPNLGMKFPQCRGTALWWHNLHQDGKPDFLMNHEVLPLGAEMIFLRAAAKGALGVSTPSSQVVASADPRPAMVLDPRQLAPPAGAPRMGPHRFALPNSPKVTVFKDFASKDEVDHLLGLAAQAGSWQQAGPAKPICGDTSNARCCDLQIGQTSIVRSLEERAARLVGVDVSQLEHLSLLRVEPGQSVGVRSDGNGRSRTLCLYLNDLPSSTEGETHFPNLGLKVLPHCGTALLWTNLLQDGSEDADTQHEELPPKSATKYSVRFHFSAKLVRKEALPRQLEGVARLVDPLAVAPYVAGGPPRMLALHEDRRIALITNVMTDDEIAHFLQLAQTQWAPSEVRQAAGDAGNLNTQDRTYRTSSSALLEFAQTFVVKAVEERVAQLSQVPVDYLERANLVRYQPGQQFKVHHDGTFRQKTLFVYLNDLPEDDGGETLFPNLGLLFRPRKGCALLWSNLLPDGRQDLDMQHEGLPPKSATKYGINFFINKRPLRALGVAMPPRPAGSG
mmetsp:Transcript_14762/g.33561  ORF Transcript_14762/g.33561 Transcript_14762/m.33561 type:complete len:958 (+) Transcript_14762:58-2931(+)